MKKTIYISGIIGLLLTFAGTLLKLFHLPGAGILFTLGILFTILWFLPLALLNQYKAKGSKKLTPLYILILITGVLEFGGGLFALMGWPFREKVLMVSIPFPFLVLLPVFVYYSRKEEYISLKSLVPVLFLLAYMGVTSAFMTIGPMKSFYDEAVYLEQELHRTNEVLVRYNDHKYKELSNDKVTPGLQEKTSKLVAKIKSLKQDMVLEAPGGQGSNPDGYNPTMLVKAKGKDSKDPVKKILFYENRRTGLGRDLYSFQQFTNSIAREEKLFLVSLDGPGQNIQWISKAFHNAPLVWAETGLSNMQNRVLLKEKQCLDNLLINPH
jgi:hypothetical protein